EVAVTGEQICVAVYQSYHQELREAALKHGSSPPWWTATHICSPATATSSSILFGPAWHRIPATTPGPATGEMPLARVTRRSRRTPTTSPLRASRPTG